MRGEILLVEEAASRLHLGNDGFARPPAVKRSLAALCDLPQRAREVWVAKHFSCARRAEASRRVVVCDHQALSVAGAELVLSRRPHRGALWADAEPVGGEVDRGGQDLSQRDLSRAELGDGLLSGRAREVSFESRSVFHEQGEPTSHHPATAPGTVTEWACVCGISAMPLGQSFKTMSSEILRALLPDPFRAWTFFFPLSKRSRKQSPPRPGATARSEWGGESLPRQCRSFQASTSPLFSSPDIDQPVEQGSVTASAADVATAASTALPPRSRTCTPASVA